MLEERGQGSMESPIVAYLCVYSSVRAVEDALSQGNAVEVQPIDMEMRKYPVMVGNSTIGRTDDQTIQLDDLFGVSAQHCRLQVSENGKMHWLMDQASTNGTFINDHQLTPHWFYQLRHGDRIAFAATKAVYLYEPHVLESLSNEDLSMAMPNILAQSLKDSFAKYAPLSVSAGDSVTFMPTEKRCSTPQENDAADGTRVNSPVDELDDCGLKPAVVEAKIDAHPKNIEKKVSPASAIDGPKSSSPSQSPRKRKGSTTTSTGEPLAKLAKEDKNQLAPHLEADCRGVSSLVIMFSHLKEADRLKAVVTKLGGSITDDWRACTHLVTDRVRRTVKFMCATAAGREIVSERWLLKCGRDRAWVSCKPYRIKDKDAEAAFGFDLSRLTDSHARDTDNNPIVAEGLLKGFSVYSSPNVRPPPEEMKNIVEAAGGKALLTPPSLQFLLANNSTTIILATEEDMSSSLLDGYAQDAVAKTCIYSSELLMTGILQGKLNFNQCRLQLPGRLTARSRSKKLQA